MFVICMIDTHRRYSSIHSGNIYIYIYIVVVVLILININHVIRVLNTTVEQNIRIQDKIKLTHLSY